MEVAKVLWSKDHERQNITQFRVSRGNVSILLMPCFFQQGLDLRSSAEARTESYGTLDARSQTTSCAARLFLSNQPYLTNFVRSSILRYERLLVMPAQD